MRARLQDREARPSRRFRFALVCAHGRGALPDGLQRQRRRQLQNGSHPAVQMQVVAMTLVDELANGRPAGKRDVP